ncbi:hypothetical protein [Deinococcus sp.]|uniref:hypothetical protein n=1 Tax=Deinococcus sp. TaxID=47478 RepID=UPI003B5BD1F9
MLDFLNSNLYPTLLTLIVAFATWFFPKRGDKNLITYAVITEEITSNTSDIEGKLEIFYDEIKVKRLAKSHLYFWNNGKNVIKFGEFSEKNPLRIAVPHGDYLECSSVKSTDEAKAMNIVARDSYVNRVNFEFLNPGEGGAFEIYHDPSFGGNPVLLGTLAGGRIEKRASKKQQNGFLSKKLWVSFYIYIVNAFIGIVIPALVIINIREYTWIIFAFLVIFISPVCIYIAWLALESQPAGNMVPKSLAIKTADSEENPDDK